LNSDSTA